MKCLFSIFPSIAVFSATLAGGNKEVTETHFGELKQVLMELEENAPLIKEEFQRLEEMKAGVLLADSVRGWKLNLNLQGQSIQEDRPSQSYLQRYHAFGSAFISKPIYHWGALISASEIARIENETSMFRLSNLISELKSSTRDSYLDLIVLKDQIELNQNTISSVEDTMNRISQKQKLGLTNELDVKNAELNLLEKQIALEDLNRSLVIASRRFRELTGWNDVLYLDPNASFQEFQKDYPFNTFEPELIAGGTSYSVERIKNEIEVEARKIKIAESGLKPKVNFLAGFFQDQVPLANNEDSFRRNNFLVGLEVNWAIWDSSKSKAEKSQSLARKRRLEMSLERESKSFRITLDGMKSELDSLAKKVQMTRKLVEIAKKRLIVSEIEYTSDRITLNQFMDARISLDQAKIKRLESICNYLKVKNRLEEVILSKYE